MRGTVEERFWAKVEPEPNTGCWLWSASTVKGYGQFQTGTGRKLSHRLSYELLVGPIPEGLQLDHLCRVRCCVNPAHLEPVTLQENLRRGIGGWNNAVKTHCPQGHPYDATNTYLNPSTNGRHCRICKKAQTFASYRRNLGR